MELQKEVCGNILRISITGELDDHSSEEARTYIDSTLLRDQAIRELQLDLSGLSFMDSSGLGVLLGRYRIMAERGGRVVLSGTNRYADRIIKMAGIYALVEKGE